MEGHVTQVRIVSQFLGATTPESTSMISLIESRSRVNSYLSGYDLSPPTCDALTWETVAPSIHNKG